MLDQADRRGCESVFVYVAVGDEVDTRELVEVWLSQGKRVAVPWFDDAAAMRAAALESLESLLPPDQCPFGVPTVAPPRAEDLDPPIDLAVVPCLAVDEAGGRLGQGGGHYDRWLARQPDVFTLALAFECQVVEAVPAGPHDRPVHAVATEARWIDIPPHA